MAIATAAQPDALYDTKSEAYAKQIIARSRELVHERDAALERAEIATARLHAFEKRHAHYLGITCDGCRDQLGISASFAEPRPGMIVGLALIAGWRLGPATIAALEGMRDEDYVAIPPGSDRDLCPRCR